MTDGTMNNWPLKTAPQTRGVPIENRELFFNSSQHKLFIYYDSYIPISAKVDDFNIVENANDEIALNKDVYVKETVCNLTISNRCIVVTGTVNSIIIFTEYNKDNNIHFGGLISFSCNNSKDLYEIDFVNTGSYMLRGCSSNDEKAKFVKVTWGGRDFLGLLINSNEVHNIHIHGFGPLYEEPNYYENHIKNGNFTVKEI